MKFEIKEGIEFLNMAAFTMLEDSYRKDPQKLKEKHPEFETGIKIAKEIELLNFSPIQKNLIFAYLHYKLFPPESESMNNFLGHLKNMSEEIQE